MSFAVMPMDDWQNIVDSVRAKTGKNDTLKSSEVASEIDGISGGGNNVFIEYIQGTKTEITAEDLAGVTEIRKYAFYSSDHLTKIIIPDNVTTCGVYAFQNCTALVSAVVGNGVTSEIAGVFAGCTNLAKVILGKGLKQISWQCFFNCKSLMEVICLAETPPYIGNSNVFYGVPENCIFKVKSASVEAYKSATNWSVRADYIIALTPEEEAQYGG